MVLEDPTTNDSFVSDSSAPPSDDDVYDSESASFQPLPTDLPRSIFGSESGLRKLVMKRQKDHAALLRRPLTKQEAEFSAYYSAKFYAITRYGIPTGTCAGLWRAYSTRSTYKFPFISQDRLKPNVEYFPHPRIPIFRGGNAKIFWHGLRTGAYVWIGMSAAELFFVLYGMAVVSTAAARDPRGKVFLDAAVGNQKNRTSKKSVSSTTISEPDRLPSTDGFQEPSPSPANETQEPLSANTVKVLPKEENPTSGGSAWDRLRQRASSGKESNWKKSESREGSRDNDTGFASKGEEDIQSSREKEQREFDRRVEQERRGEGFDSGKGSSDRW